MKTAPVVKLKCKLCDDVIRSEYFGHCKRCSCGAIAVDETEYYCRFIGNREDREQL